MSHQLLGIFALIGAPWLLIGFFVEQRMPHLQDLWFTGLWGLLYISGWMCAVIALRRLRATGNSSFGRILLTVLLFCLSMANISNVIQMMVEKDKPSFFMFIDMFWPLSNVLMLIVGIRVIVVSGLPGWKRYIPLATGLWFPLAMLTSLINNSSLSYLFAGIYSAVAWILLAIVVMTTKKEQVKTK